jgi:hypothetical protein
LILADAVEVVVGSEERVGEEEVCPEGEVELPELRYKKDLFVSLQHLSESEMACTNGVR